MKIISVPNPILRQASAPITAQTKHLRRLLDELKHTLMYNDIGVGLAAPQLGYSQRALVLKLPDEKGRPQLTVYLNPVITAHSSTVTLGTSKNKTDNLEGCLSIPKIYSPVYRYSWIDLTYQTWENGQLFNQQTRLEGFPARVLQHETDHLNGILFIDHTLRNRLPIYQEINGDLQEISLSDFQRQFGKII